MKYLLPCIQSGIAPALQAEGDKTYWGQIIEDELDEEVKKLLGQDLDLNLSGQNREETEAKEDAKEIIEQAATKRIQCQTNDA